MQENHRARAAGSLSHLIETGAIKPPLEVERTYKGQHFTARVEVDGRITFAGKTYNSLSVAAATARAIALNRSDYQSTNGWVFWCYRDAVGKLRRLDELRKEQSR